MKKNLLLIIIVLLIAVVAVIFLDAHYHPWEEKLSGTGLFRFENIPEGIEKAGEESVLSRMELIEYQIYKLFFASTSNSILSKIAQWILTPIKDIGESVSAALAYAGFFDSRDMDPIHWGLSLTAYFVLFYLFTFLKTKSLSAINSQVAQQPTQQNMATTQKEKGTENEGKKETLITKAIGYFIPYAVETIFNFIFLVVTFWIMEFFFWLHSGPVYDWYNNVMNHGNPLIMLPTLIFTFLVMIVLVIIVIAGFISVMIYYALIAMPVILVALLPSFIWLPIRLWLCVVIELFVIVKVFPILHEHVDMLKVLVVITWPIRKALDFFI